MMDSKQVLDKLLALFDKEFESLNEKYKSVKYFKLVESSLEKNVKFELDWRNGNLNIRYNKSLLLKYINNSKYDKKDLESLFKYCACHEYGHTQLPKQKPSDEEIKLYKELIQINLFRFIHVFKEFYAEYFASQHLDEIPERYLIELASGLELDPNKLKHPDFKFSQFLINNLHLGNKFLVFNLWHLLDNCYKKYNLESFQKLIHGICSKFHVIVKQNSDYNSMKIDIYILVKFIEQLDPGLILFYDIYDENKLLSIKFSNKKMDTD